METLTEPAPTRPGRDRYRPIFFRCRELRNNTEQHYNRSIERNAAGLGRDYLAIRHRAIRGGMPSLAASMGKRLMFHYQIDSKEESLWVPEKRNSKAAGTFGKGV